MLSRTLKMAFWMTYDHLGKLLLLNFLCALALVMPLGMAWAALASGDGVLMVVLAPPLALLALGGALPMACAGMAHFMKILIEKRDAALSDFFWGLRRYALRAVGVAVVFLAALACLTTSAWFYAAQLGATLPWLGYALSALALWCLIFTGMASLLVMPALVQKNAGVFAAWKVCMLLVLDNPLFCVGLMVYMLFCGAFCMLPPIFMCFSIAPMMALSASAYEMLSRKYAAVAAVRASGAAAKTVNIDFGDAEDDYLNRGFRDFLFPWKN